MRYVTPAARNVLEAGGFTHRWVADVMYDGVRRLEDVPLRDVALDDDDSAAIKGSGKCQIVWTDDFGHSILPTDIGDVLSPFGTELVVSSLIRVGNLTERVPYGVFQVTDIPQMRSQHVFFQGVHLSAGDTLDLVLKDRLWTVQNDPFDVPSVPSQLSSVYREIQNLTGWPIVFGVADGPISRSVPYKESRLEALLDLADVRFAVPYMTSDGSVSLRPKAWPAPVARISKKDGTLVRVGRGMSAEGSHNRVVFRSTGTDQSAIFAAAEIPSGPFRASNPTGGRPPAGRRTTFRSNDFITNSDQAAAFAAAELAKVSKLQSVKWPITLTFDPRFESGDVVELEDESGKVVRVRFLNINRRGSGSALMDAVVLRG